MTEIRKMLPQMKITDRITWGVLCWIFFNLLWLRFLENYVPQWVGAAIATALVAAFIAFGPGPGAAGDEGDGDGAEETAHEEDREGE
ncbi:MAG: hypothetical protein NUW12_01915 [Firmicutes bacterium]|nr:hypothetical protein [Bacillota bacterium]MDH7494798.1 hypothetical protein [Bacillota bacterium]